jgi:3-hydroxymyristoyl/3-hydroxydecanoyl-(acyl carrier protein) dehydratase
MSVDPIVLEERATPPEAVVRVSIPADLEYFAGHFPGSPIVPGVVQLKWAIDSARRLLGVRGCVARMEALKFQQVMRPGAAASLTLKWVAADRKLYFAYAADEARFSSGRLFFGGEQ